MSQNHKRKFEDYHNELHDSSNPESYEVVGSVLTAPKSQPSHASDLPLVPNSQRVSRNESSQDNGSLPHDSKEWQIVDRRDKRKPKRKKAGDEKDRVKYPELTSHASITAPIRIADLQALALYALADGIGPSWVAFKHARHTRKVVVLMVPGLERAMFDGSMSIDKGADSTVGLEQKESIVDECRGRDSDFRAWRNGVPAKTYKESNPMEFKVQYLPKALQPLVDIFQYVWQVRAPGDSKYAKLHSPIQAMLISPLPQSRENKAIKGPKPPVEEKGWQSQRTAVAVFIHTANDLRDADYPLHPAVLDGDVEAALLEQERRDKTGQNAAGGWVDTRVSNFSDGSVSGTAIQQGSITSGRTVYAVDCEMVLTSDDKYSLARISIVDWNGTTILDELVKPSLPIKNYYTQFSGMTSAILDPVRTSLSEVQSKLLDLFTPHCILLGHSLESDLTAMKLTHPFIIDTSLIYPHPRGPPLRSSLKFLAQKYLRREIQQHDSKGHNSVEDALAVLDLVKLKCEKGPKWGTSEAAGEPIFRRLARNTRKDAGGIDRGITSAMVDYGTPERGYGKEATVHVGCESDDEIVKAVARAANGDPDGKVVPGGGVHFTWGRLRELESFRGWCNNNREYTTVDKLHVTRSQQASTLDPAATWEEPDFSVGSVEHDSITDTTAKHDLSIHSENHPLAPPSTTPTLQSTITSTISHIRAIYDALPPCTLFIVYTGTGDPREVGRLQKMQQQFRREFKVKKWNDLSVKWTDDEEQALKKAVERARDGMALMCVK